MHAHKAKTARGARWAAAGPVWVALAAALLGWAWLEVFILRPVPPARWATAPDAVAPAARGERVVLVLIDGMNADRAFDPGSMPFLAGQRAAGAWGIAAAQVPTLTGSAVTTLGTGRWTTLLDAIYNFQAPPSPSDSVFRRLDDAGRRAALIGDSAWASRFGRWADVITAAPDHGIADVHRSDAESAAAFEAWLATDMRHPLVVMHWVGADHAGHGAASTADGSPYAARLSELDAELARLWVALRARDPDASMLVISDHGMTAKGGHGGGEDETRRAPFVWWGPGVAARGPLSLTQAEVAPSLAAYLGVLPPAEAAQPAHAALFSGLSPADAGGLTVAWERQRRAVMTAPDGSAMPNARPARPWAIAALGALTLGALAAAWRARALLGVALAAAAPVLRWWGGHLWLHAGLLAAASVAAMGWRKGAPWALAALGLAATHGGPWALAGWAPHWALGVALRVGVVAWALLPLKADTAADTAPATAPAPGARTPALTQRLGWLLPLGALSIAQRLWPAPATSGAALLLSAAALVALRARGGRAALGAGALLGAALYSDGAFAALCLLAAMGWALAHAAPLDARPRLAAWSMPALVVAWEVLAYFSLGKDYSLSAVQVALAFTLDAELNIGLALAMVALGEVAPWALCALLLRDRLPAALPAMGAVLAGRLAALMASFGLVERSFWVTSSVVPALISAWILAVTWPLVAWAARPPHGLQHGSHCPGGLQ